MKRPSHPSTKNGGKYYAVFVELSDFRIYPSRVFARDPDEAFSIVKQNIPAIEKVRGGMVLAINIVPIKAMHRRRVK